MMDYIEISAKTLNDAITKACIELSVSSDNLDYKVVSEGSSGFLGFGSKPAIIKARKMVVEEEPELEIKKVFEEKRQPKKEFVKKEQGKKETPKKETPKKEPVKAAPVKEQKVKETATKETAVKETPVKKEAPVQEVKKEKVVTPKTEEEVNAMKEAAGAFLKDVFAAMALEVKISMNYDQEEGSLDIDFEGPEMGLLIGKRGQTLDSLQYLTSLVVNKGQNDYVRVKLDTENYRKRRKDTLENLAKNIAFKVKKTRRAVSLEPMNPYERRIIHSALQNNKFVKTTSEGEEPYRHVVVLPKR